MKKCIFLFSVLFCFVLSLNATIHIVDKNPTAPAGSYPDVNAALAAASPGDTVYITPAESAYNSFNVIIRVVVMGNGHNPNPSSDYPWTSAVETISFGHANATGTVITGLRIKKINGNANSTKDISIIKNRITEGISAPYSFGSGWVIRNNIFYFYTTYYPRTIDINDNADWIIENNIFSGRRTSGTQAFFEDSDDNNVLITNNIFIGDSLNNGSYRAFTNVSNAIVSNNIFYVREPVNCEYCNMSNNLTYRTAQDTLPYGNNTGAYNIPNQDPMFVNAPVDAHSYNYIYDYHLRPGSPGINAGSDGRNIGIYGGVYPYSDIIPIPKVLNVNVKTPNLHPGDSLEVKVKAVKY